MDKVYECDIEKKKELTKVLEENPYEKDSFARIGYKTKEGVQIGLDEKKIYIYISADEGLIKKADEKLKDLCKEAEREESEKVIKNIKEEEEQATSGFGDIFG
ncbi:hypothetical protein JXB01_04405 [Candidatus Micrarchaeota archaeon]|nr:hypothetical protein [Candidatus Micrarchaeota archaeon]